jgi:hypothetical protein
MCTLFLVLQIKIPSIILCPSSRCTPLQFRGDRGGTTGIRSTSQENIDYGLRAPAQPNDGQPSQLKFA